MNLPPKDYQKRPSLVMVDPPSNEALTPKKSSSSCDTVVKPLDLIYQEKKISNLPKTYNNPIDDVLFHKAQEAIRTVRTSIKNRRTSRTSSKHMMEDEDVGVMGFLE